METDIRKVYIAGCSAITSLGFDASENWENLYNGNVGIRTVDDRSISNTPILLSLVDCKQLDKRFYDYGKDAEYTKLEKMLILSIKDAAKKTTIDLSSDKTLIIISTTKGNVDYLGAKSTNKIPLYSISDTIGDLFKCRNKPILLSTACISGTLAILIAYRLLKNSKYENIVVAGADVVSSFIVSGFQSLKATSTLKCRPFDISRDGFCAGEGAGSILLTNNSAIVKDHKKVIIAGGASTNDANHISGPSRTGDGLFDTIVKTLSESCISADGVNYIMAHGTATPYNDEMEAKALTSAGLNQVPLTSIKGYIGHTFGAAGIIESVIGLKAMDKNVGIKTEGYSFCGTTSVLNIVTSNKPMQINNFLKTSAGFGGTNATLLFKKDIISQ